ncbi:MAG: phospholipase D-like domain-containing protein [Candidatus Algichlamydia australiensis]|nr:phospholipase D-like domain-containing protein [Chlamydiales bacterium]
MPLPSAKELIRFYGNEQRTDLKQLTLHLIKRAKKNLCIATYQLRDPEVISLLNSRAANGLPIEIYTHHKGKKPKLHPSISLHRIKTSGLMHEKILLVDKKISFLGSANLTSESLRMHRNLMVGLYSKELTSSLREHLRELPAKRAPEEFLIGNQKVELIYLPNKEAPARLAQLIEKKQKDLRMAMFTLTHPLLTEALAQHPHAQIAIDHYTARGSSKKSFSLLPYPYESRGLELLHHKFCLLNKKTLIFGSANWTKSAFEKNRDYVMIIHNLNKKQSNYIKKLTNHLFYESKH